MNEELVARLNQCLRLTRVLENEFVRSAIQDAALALSSQVTQHMRWDPNTSRMVPYDAMEAQGMSKPKA